jgi:hypothetical protein
MAYHCRKQVKTFRMVAILVFSLTTPPTIKLPSDKVQDATVDEPPLFHLIISYSRPVSAAEDGELKYNKMGVP